MSDLAQVFEPSKAAAKQTNVSLRSAGDLSKFGARLVREAYAGKLESAKARDIVGMLDTLRKLQEASDLDDRLAKLETALGLSEEAEA